MPLNRIDGGGNVPNKAPAPAPAPSKATGTGSKANPVMTYKGPVSMPTRTPYVAPAGPAAPPTPVGGGGGGGGFSEGFTGGGGQDGSAAPIGIGGGEAPWDYKTDSGYQSQLAAIMKALQTYDADYNKQLGNYDTDFDTSMKSLGWDDKDGVQGAGAGDWAREDKNTAAGRGFTSQRDDFAARGMLQSTDYARAVESLMRSLNDQKGSMDQGRGRFRDDLGSQRSAFNSEQESAKMAAQQEAIARRAAGLV